MDLAKQDETGIDPASTADPHQTVEPPGSETTDPSGDVTVDPAAAGERPAGDGEDRTPDGEGPEGVVEQDPETPAKAPKRRRFGWFRRAPLWSKILMITGLVLAVIAGCTATGAWFLVHRYEGKVAHENLLGDAAPTETGRLTQPVPLNLLVLGSDSRRGETDKGDVAGERSDVIMLMHINAAHDSAAVVSIPRDSYVDVPAAGPWPGGKNKLNSAFAYGGAPHAAKTIMNLTGVSLDGAMVVNFAGIRKMVDAVGGVRVCVDYDVKSSFSDRLWTKGCHDMDGAESEEFMRERYNVPGGDIGRIHQQQLVVQGVIDKVASAGLLNNPMTLDKLLSTAAESLTLDNSLDLRQLLTSVKDVRPANIKYVTVPYTNLGLKTPVGSAVQLNDVKAASLFESLRSDTVDQWLIDNPPDTRKR